MASPLADKLRPRTLEDVVGQSHLLAQGQVLRSIIEGGTIPNMIFYGPSGVGKTTVANIIANKAGKKLYRLNGTTASTADIKEIVSLSLIHIYSSLLGSQPRPAGNPRSFSAAAPYLSHRSALCQAKTCKFIVLTKFIVTSDNQDRNFTGKKSRKTAMLSHFYSLFPEWIRENCVLGFGKYFRTCLLYTSTSTG